MSMKILRSLRENGNMLIFILFALSVFIKCVYFHYACFNYVAVSSLWQAPLEFLAFYFAKLLPALFFASFVFLFKFHCLLLFIKLLNKGKLNIIYLLYFFMILLIFLLSSIKKVLLKIFIWLKQLSAFYLYYYQDMLINYTLV